MKPSLFHLNQLYVGLNNPQPEPIPEQPEDPDNPAPVKDPIKELEDTPVPTKIPILYPTE